MFTPLDVTEDLVALRQALGLSRSELAQKLGVHRNSIYWWETGRSVPRRASLKILAKLAKQAGLVSA